MKSIDKLAVWVGYVLTIIFALVVFHAPLSVYFSQFFIPEIVKSWKEILLLLLIPFVVFVMYKRQLLTAIVSDRLFQLVTLFALLHIVLLLAFTGSFYQQAAGLAIDLRFLLFFTLVYCITLVVPGFRREFLAVGGLSAMLSVVFTVLQVAILPKDFLATIGYSKETIAPYLTVDKNTDFVRINGTLRGPNPLGAYAVVLTSTLFAWVVCHIKTAQKYAWHIVTVSIFLLVVLWNSYSRSAWLAFLTSIIVLLFVKYHKKIQTKHLVSAAALSIVVIGGLLYAQRTDFVQNVILHNNPQDGSIVDSDSARIESIESSVETIVLRPYGSGIGSTGSASLESDKPLIIENYYLFVAHETGWFGLGLFVAVYILILGRLYVSRRDWLSLGVFASGIGLAVVGLFLPVWADDTVSLVWFGLAAVALGSHYKVGNQS